jgi:predicted SAM-dependent methyltransferase
MWNQEVTKIMPYCFGLGVDIGCGRRSITRGIRRLDFDPLKTPDIVASGDAIPVKDSHFDYLVGQHAFEHFEDQEKLLREWLRVVKDNGYVLIIHPDLEFTGPQKPEAYNPSLGEDPFNKHYHERTQAQFEKWIRVRQKYGFKVMDIGPACGNWSFYVVLRVKKDHSPTLSKSSGQDGIEAKT